MLYALSVVTLPVWPQAPFGAEPPANRILRSPETVLSGVHIKSLDGEGEIQALVGTLGNPTLEAGDPRDGLLHYSWELDGSSLEVTVIRQTAARIESRIDSIEVWGRRPTKKIGVTGAGLSLGSSVRDAKRTYPFSFKYPADWLNKQMVLLNGYTTALVSTDEFSPLLEIDFDQEVVVHMKLTNRCAFMCF